MLRLDYLSCALTIVSTVMVGRRKWQGWIVAGVNSAIICVIGVRTAQTGFIPANLFCLGLYACNIYQWRFGKSQERAEAVAPRSAEPVQSPVEAIAKEHKRRVASGVTRERICRPAAGIARTRRVRSAATSSASMKLK